MGSIRKKEELKLVTTENFAGLDVGFYQDDKGDVYMTRNQIGEALGYKNPNDSIRMLHKRNERRMDNFSVSIKLFGTDDKIDEYEPRVRYVDEILSSTDTMSITQIAKDYGLSGRRLNQILHERGIQYKVNDQWVLYAKYAGAGYTKSHTHRYEKGAGRIGTNIQTVWTQKGRLLIHNTLESIGIIAEVDKDE